VGRRSRQSFLKRAKEKKRQEKAALKRERRLARRQGETLDVSPTEDGRGVRALILVGLQSDFFPGGTRCVPGGEDVLPVANRLMEEFSRAALPIVATRAWHPVDHCSFTDQGGPRAPYCVADTPGARFHPELRLPSDTIIVTMTAEADGDAFSGFQETDLTESLRSQGVAEIVICGLATDHCVKATALDGRREGFAVTVVREGIRGTEEHAGDSARALREMERAGVGIASAGTVIVSSMT
jgi:nicotinamidase/pyrazinamidase